ncbi:hypothetical protein AAC387_Pa03g2904 [Persea americana]
MASKSWWAKNVRQNMDHETLLTCKYLFSLSLRRFELGSKGWCHTDLCYSHLYNEILGKGASKIVYRAFDEYEGIELAVICTILKENKDKKDAEFNERFKHN